MNIESPLAKYDGNNFGNNGAPAIIQKKAADHYENIENVSDSAEAYSSIALIGALVFGFASANLITADGDRDSVAFVVFQVLMASVCVLSCYGLIVMTLQFYHLKRIQGSNPKQLAEFLAITFMYRHTARATTWVSLIVFLVALAVYSYTKNVISSASIIAAILGFGAIIVYATWRRLSEIFGTQIIKK